MAELGSSGLKQYNGVIEADFLREWRGIQAYKRADEMRLNSSVIAALLSAIEQSVTKVDITLNSEDENDPRLEVWDAFTAHVQGGFGNHLREALGFLPFGFSLFEIVWGHYDRFTIPVKLAPRGQDTVYRWLLSDTGDIEGFVQQAAPTYKLVEIPSAKLLHYRFHPERNNPEGRSILRTAWVPYWYAKNISQIEGIGIERDLAGLPVVTMPESADTDEDNPNSDAAKAAKIVRNIRRDEQEGIVLPAGWTLALLSTGGTRQFDTDKIINRYESRMLMSALAQFLMLGQTGVGSYSLSSDQSDLFVMSVNSTADIVTDTLQAQLLPRLMALNGYPSIDGLTLTHSPAGDVDTTAIADLLAKVAPFLTWTVEDEMWLRDIAKLPKPALEELEAEREMIREEKRAMAQQIQGRQSEADQDEDADEEDIEDEEDPEDAMHAVLFAARPDQGKRTRFERELDKRVRAGLKAWQARVVSAAKAVRNG